MGIPVYWSLSPSIDPPTALKPTLKRTRPLPSSIRRQPHARDQRALYSEVVRRQAARDDDCPLATSHRHHPRFGVSQRDNPPETDEFIEQLEVFSNSTRVHHGRPSYDPPALETLHFPPQLPSTGRPLSMRGVPAITDGIPTPIPEPSIPEPSAPTYLDLPAWALEYAHSPSSSTSSESLSTSPAYRGPIIIDSYDTRDSTPFDGFGVHVESPPSSDDEMTQPAVNAADFLVRPPRISQRLERSGNVFFQEIENYR